MERLTRKQILENVKNNPKDIALIAEIKEKLAEGKSIYEVLRQEQDSAISIRVRNRASAARWQLKKNGYKNSFSKREYLAIFDIDFVFECVLLDTFVKDKLSQLADSKKQIYYLELAANIKVKILQYACTRGITKEDLLEREGYIVINTSKKHYEQIMYRNIDNILAREDIQRRIKVMQKRFDDLFKRKEDETINVDAYKLGRYALYSEVIRDVEYINKVSFQLRKKNSEPAVTVSEFITKGLKGYSSVKHHADGKNKIWPENKIQANLAIKHLGPEMDEWSKDASNKDKGADPNRLMGKLSQAQWVSTKGQADRLALREGLTRPELYEKLGIPAEKCKTNSKFDDFVENELSQLANDKKEIFAKDLAAKQYQKIRGRANYYGITPEKLFKTHTEYTLVREKGARGSKLEVVEEIVKTN